jgi:predicted TIM-barrel enzyme
MATEQTTTAFAEAAQSSLVKNESGSAVDVTAGTQGSIPSSKSYQLVKSPTGNMYVEVSSQIPKSDIVIKLASATGSMIATVP